MLNNNNEPITQKTETEAPSEPAVETVSQSQNGQPTPTEAKPSGPVYNNVPPYQPYQPPYGQYPQNSGYYPYGQYYGYPPYGQQHGQQQYGGYYGYPYQNGYPYPYNYPYGYAYPYGANYPSPEELQKKAERKAKINKLGNAVGIPLCLFSVISYIITQIFIVITTLLAGNQAALSIFTDPNVNYILSAGISVICFTLPFLITSRLLKLKWSESVSFKRAEATKSISVIMLGLGVCAISNYASSLLSSFMLQFTGKSSQTTMMDFGTDWKSFVISLLCVGILPALLEEFAFRGVVLGALRKYMNDGTAIFLSALLFGLLHGNLQQIPFAFGVGLALGFATVYCKSIVPAIVLHGLNNTFSVVLDFATRNMNPLTSQITTMLYLAVLLLIGVCGFIMLVVTDKDAFILSSSNSESSKTDIGQFSSSVAIIIFFVISGLSIIVTQFL